MSWLDSLFGGGEQNWSNPASSAMPYLDKIKGEYGNPDLYNQIAGQYKQSPGYQFRLNQAMQAGNNSAGAGGMLGSGQHQFVNAQTAEGLANQDFNNWWNQRMGLNQDMGSVLSKKGEYAYSGTAGENQHNAAQQQRQQEMIGQIVSMLGKFFGQ